MNRKKKVSGFTLVELLIVVSIVAILAGMLFSRVLVYQEMAEKAAVQQVVGALQTALILQYGHRMASGAGVKLSSISNENPMDWLMQKPGNYAGEFNNVTPQGLEPGNWVYDKSRHELIYLPYHTEYLETAKNGAKWLRYRVKQIYEPSYSDKKIMQFAGVSISPVEPFKWVIKEKE